MHSFLSEANAKWCGTVEATAPEVVVGKVMVLYKFTTSGDGTGLASTLFCLCGVRACAFVLPARVCVFVRICVCVRPCICVCGGRDTYVAELERAHGGTFSHALLMKLMHS